MFAQIFHNLQNLIALLDRLDSKIRNKGSMGREKSIQSIGRNRNNLLDKIDCQTNDMLSPEKYHPNQVCQ